MEDNNTHSGCITEGRPGEAAQPAANHVASVCLLSLLLRSLLFLLPHRSSRFPRTSSGYSHIFHLACRRVSTSKCFTQELIIVLLSFPASVLSCSFFSHLPTVSNLVAVDIVMRDPAAAAAGIHPGTRPPLTLP